MEVDPSSVESEDPSASATLRYQAKKSEREDVQRRTFTKWINTRLVRAGRSPISDLFEDMKDGTVLMYLIEVLTGQNLNPEKGNTRVHHLNNVNHSIKFLEKQYNIKLVNICSDDVVNGNTKLILGLIWNLVLHWQIKDVMKVPGGDRPQSNLEKTLLSWCKDCTQGYQKVNITNFTTSFRDGLAFNALFHHFRPNDFHFEDLLRKDNLYNLKHAFDFAEKNFNIEQILDPEDVNVEQPDKKSILIYIMCCYQTLNRLSPLGHHLSPDSASFVVTSPSSPPPFYDLISSSEEMPWMPQEKTSTMASAVMSSPALPDDKAPRISDEVEKFQESLESALVWLLQAKSNLTERPDISEDVKSVKKQFQDHEEFMVQLTEKQTEVGELFEWGNEMLRKSSLGEWKEKEIEAQMRLLNEQWEELRVHAMEKQTRLQRNLMNLQQEQLDDLAAWLERMERTMENSRLTLHCGSLQERVDAHKALQEEVESQQQQVSSLQNMVVVVDDINSDDAYEALEKQLENLGHRWAAVCRWVEESCANLKEEVTLWGEYEKRKDEFSSWLDSCESQLNGPELTKKVAKDSQFKDIVSQVKALKTMELEMDRWMLNFDELSNTGASLEKHISEHEESINKINHDMQGLKDRWDALVKAMEAKSKEIEDSGVELRDTGDGSIIASRECSDGSFENETIDAWLIEESSTKSEKTVKHLENVLTPEKVASIIKAAEENVTWLQERCNNLPSDPARSSIELNRRRDLCKNLLEQLNQRESLLLALENDLDDNSEFVISVGNKRTELTQAWKALKRKIEMQVDRLSSGIQAVSRYNALMKDEIRWQEQMNKILNRRPRPSGDAEELAEELDLLENLTSSRNSMDLEQLKELSSHITTLTPQIHASSLVIPAPINMEEFIGKNLSLVERAKERMKYLEEGINAAQSREGRIIEMTHWMAEVSGTLQHHLEADLLAGDVPEEHNGLVQEFAEYEEFLVNLESDVEVFKREGKHEAADRLIQQIDLLKKQFEEVKMKLLRFQKPPDFDAKMSLVKRVLEEINDSIQLLEIGGSQIEEIQNQLECYQKFYKKMSELKPDVEYVVRTGRQVVDKKQVEFPNRLNTQIDAIKLQYNRLGSQVTTGKVSLEKCLRLSRKITKELDNIRSLVTKIEEKFPDKCEGRSHPGLDKRTEELVAIDSLLTEANAKKGIIQTLKDAVAQWNRISVEGSMKEPSVNVSETEEMLVSAINLLNDRRNKLNIHRPGNEGPQRSLDIIVSPSLLTSLDKFLDRIKSADASDVEELKKLVREEDNFENEINLELKRLARVKDDRKSQGDLEVAERITNVVNNLQSRWMVCKSELKAKLQQQQQQMDNSNSNSGDFSETFHSDISNFNGWIEEAEAKLGSDGIKINNMDEKQIQLMRDEIYQKKVELEAIARRLQASKNSQLISDASPLLMRINRKLQKLQSNIPPHPPPPQSYALSPSDSIEERRTPITELRVQTPLERQIFFDSNGKPVSTARNEVKRPQRNDEVDRKDEVFQEDASSQCRVTKSSTNRKDEKDLKGVVEDQINQRPSSHHKDWNIAMPDELVQVTQHHYHHHHYHQQPSAKFVLSSGQASVGPQNKEKFITGLNNFMSVIMEKAKPQCVLIGSTNEIDEAVKKEKTKLQELEAMIPSIKTLINKLEQMQHDPEWSQNTRALTKKLCENWDKAMQDIKDRQMELNKMRGDGLKLEAEIRDFERKLNDIGSASDSCNLQNDKNEISSQVDYINKLGHQLTKKYSTDDPKKIQSLVNNVRSKWQQVSGFEVNHEEEPQRRFAEDTRDLQLWLTRVELIVGNLLEKESKTLGSVERNQLKSAAEDLKQEIVGKRAFLNSLSSSATQIVGEEHMPSQIQGQLSDANSRWKRVKGELDDLILKLSEHQLHQHDSGGSVYSRDSTLQRNNQKLHEQLMATRSIEDALTNQPPIAEELQNIKAQKAAFQSLLDRINDQRPYVLSTLQQEKSTSDEKAKELSKELEKKWIRIQKMSADRAIELDAAIEKMTILQDSLDDLNHHLSLMEAESSSWLSLQELVKTGDVQREIMAVQAFQQKIAPIQGEVDHCNDAANQLGEVVPSHHIVAFLEDVTKRWKSLQEATEERLSALQNVSKRHGSFSQHILTASVSYPWERAVTHHNVPYYINHSVQSTHWDHPEMTKLVESLSGFDEVRFSAYRTAMKLRHLQKSFYLDSITLENLSSSFNSIPASRLGKYFPLPSSSPSSHLKRERLEESTSVSKVSTNNTIFSGSSYDGTPTSSLDRTKSIRKGEQVVGVIEIAACLRLCFEGLHSSVNTIQSKSGRDTNKKSREESIVLNVSNINVPLSMDLVLNWLLNVYDSSRNGVIRLSSFKTALVLLCNATLEEKYKYLFKLSSNGEGLVDKIHLTRLLKDCMYLPKQLGESAAFGGTNVESSIKSCFDKSGDKANISEKDFLNWMKLEPQSLVWIHVLHRLKSSEDARHQVRCQCCKQLPLRGLRYRCLKCFSYDLCQNCFFAGKTTKSHKLNHPMQEYSSETTSSENMRDLTKVFKNKFRSKRYFQKHRRIGYLPVKISLQSGEEERDDDDDDLDELSPQLTIDDSTLLQRGLHSSASENHPDVFGSTSEGFSDEHNLIAQYCKSLKGSTANVEPASPLQILKKLDAERREEVEEMIRDLENENKNLRAEYERLLRVKGLPDRSRNGWNDHGNKYVHDDDTRRIEEKLHILDENNQYLHAELFELQGENLGNAKYNISSSFGATALPSVPKQESPIHIEDNGVRELELERMLQKLQTDNLPVQPGETNVSSLFREVEQINRAVETLVDIMTEGESEDGTCTNRTNRIRSQDQRGKN